MGMKTLYLTLREEHGLRVFENRVLRRIFEPKREEVAGGWRGLHNEELHNLYGSPNISRVINLRRSIWAGHVARMEEIRKACKIVVGKSLGMRALGRPWRGWKNNIRIDLGEADWEVVD
jgi:hypothetical protein